jgi:hypothetical protein
MRRGTALVRRGIVPMRRGIGSGGIPAGSGGSVGIARMRRGSHRVGSADAGRPSFIDAVADQVFEAPAAGATGPNRGGV